MITRIKEVKEMFGWVSYKVVERVELFEVSGGQVVVSYENTNKFPLTITAWEKFKEDKTFEECCLYEQEPIELIDDNDDGIKTLRIYLK
jgi:hypothetical protein